MKYEIMLQKARETRKHTKKTVNQLKKQGVHHSVINSYTNRENYISACVNNYSTMLANARQKSYPKEARLEFLEIAREWRKKFIEAI